jgi:hypothetical protein
MHARLARIRRTDLWRSGRVRQRGRAASSVPVGVHRGDALLHARVWTRRGVGLATCCARDELERRGSRFRADHGRDVAVRVAVVLGAVGGVDLVVNAVVGVDEEEGDALSTPPARMWPSWRFWMPRNQVEVRPRQDRTYRSSPCGRSRSSPACAASRRALPTRAAAPLLPRSSPARRWSSRSSSDLHHDLDRFAVVHRPVAVGHLVEADHLVEDAAGLDAALQDVRQLLDVGVDPPKLAWRSVIGSVETTVCASADLGERPSPINQYSSPATAPQARTSTEPVRALRRRTPQAASPQ